MKQSVFVISDLHLGGAAPSAGKPGFQMCSSGGRARLAEFIRYAAGQRLGDRDATLVLAGDIVDFLAEEEFAPFTIDDAVARAKLERIMQRTEEVWHALRDFAASGSRLVLMLGNHDIELSLPGPRRLLLDRLGAGRIEFIYDNQAWVEGPAIIEHGNRYDSWNVISHDSLREVRSALSRGEDPPAFGSPAGSLMVINIMNAIKARFPFVDLLKPEDAGLLPVLAVLDPSSAEAANKAIGLWRKQSQVQFHEDGTPADLANIAAVGGKDDELIDLARKLYDEDQGNIGFVDNVKDFLEIWQLARSRKDKDAQLRKLYVALRARAQSTWQTFDVNREADVYMTPARAAAGRGFKVVVYGHTHLVKRVPLDGGAVYLNTGTWADLMQVPEAVLRGDETEGMRQLEQFVNDLAANELRKWRRLVPTFARIDLDDQTLAAADVYFFDGGDNVERVPDGALTRLRV